MKVTVEFLSLPLITQPLGKKKIEVQFQESTLADLAHELGSKIHRAKDVLLGGDGSIDHDIQIPLNGAAQVPDKERQSKVLSEGDTVTFMMLVAGG